MKGSIRRMAWEPRQAAGGAAQGQARAQPSSLADRAHGRVHGGVARDRRLKRAMPGIHHPDRARSGEARGACSTEDRYGQGALVVPAERMKAKKEHRVPLSPAAVELLNSIERKPGVDLVFPSPRTRGVLSDMALLELMRRQRLGGDTALLPLDVPRLGRRVHELPARACGGSAGAYQGRCDGSRLLAWRSAGEAAANDGRLGCVHR